MSNTSDVMMTELKLQLYTRLSAAPDQSRYTAAAIVIDMARALRKEECETIINKVAYPEIAQDKYRKLYLYLRDMALHIQNDSNATPKYLAQMLKKTFDLRQSDVLGAALQICNQSLDDSIQRKSVYGRTRS